MNLSQAEILQLNDFKMFLKYKRTWAFERFINSPAKVIGLFTGNQYGKCLTYQSLIETPNGEIPVGVLYDKGNNFSVCSYKNGKKIVTEALPPFKKPKKEPCVKVIMADGRWFEAALGHRVLTDQGWLYIADLLCNNHNHPSSCSQSQMESSSEPCQLIRASDGLRCVRKERDCPDDCSMDYRLSGGPLLSGKDTDLSSAPSQVYVRRHNYSFSCLGDLAKRYIGSLCLWLRRLSNPDVFLCSLGQSCSFLVGIFYKALQPFQYAHQAFLLLPTGGDVVLQSGISGHRHQHFFSSALKSPHLINGNRIVSYEFIACQDVYDFTVPETHNYFAAGVVHHNTCGVAFGYVMRVLGTHPIAIKNVEYWECENHLAFKTDQITEEEYLKKHRKKIIGGGVIYEGAWNSLNIPPSCPHCGGEVLKHERGSRVFRFCSETLPGQSGSTSVDGGTSEVKNTQYPEFKKWLPKFLIKKDITFRNPAMILKNIHGPEDIIVEFVSYNQSIQSTAGTQRLSIWTDEEPDQDFMSEQRPRLLAENGDWIITLTPANHITWVYDEVFEKAKVYYRTQAICDYLGHDIKQVEKTDSAKSIAIIQAASDDNPTLTRDSLESLFNEIDDPDELAIRRYGIFKQVSGRIFKDFEFPVHYVDSGKWFPDGVPSSWTHARGIDYHPQTPWAFGAMALSPTNEAFIYAELNPSPEKFTAREIANLIARTCKMNKYVVDLIDPLSKATKLGSMTVLDDMNDAFLSLKREGVCAGGYFEAWDTKGEKGRDEIRKRLKNSKKVGRPFNNTVIENGKKVNLPTLWILNTCKLSAQSMRQWRWEEYTDQKMASVKGDKNSPEQKWSHMNMVWEAIFKDQRFRARSGNTRSEHNYEYYQGAR